MPFHQVGFVRPGFSIPAGPCPVGAAEGCDLLILMFACDSIVWGKIAASLHSTAPTQLLHSSYAGCTGPGFVCGWHGVRINIGLKSRRCLNVTGVSKCVTKGATTGRCETPSPDIGRLRASTKISRHAVLAGLEGFANNGPAICSIDRFPFFCSCMNLLGCQCARTAFSVLL